MKKYHIILYIVFAVVLASCKKENGPVVSAVNKTTQQKLQSWFEAETKLNTGTVQPVLGSNAPSWGETEYVEGKSMFITPVTLKEKNKAIKYLVTKADESNNIKEGNYFVILNSKGVKKSEAENMILNENVNENFSGAILEYDINSRLLKATHYTNGKITSGAIDNIVNKPSKEKSNKTKNGDNNSFASIEECQGGELYCIEWYWQTYINGILVYEEYLYTTCECLSQGGGGSTGNPCQTQCSTQFNSLVSGTTVASDMFTSGTPVQTNPDEMQVAYRWRILKNLTWSIYSNEKATLKKTNLPSPQPQWKYVSLQHESLSFEGFSIGGTVSYAGTSLATVGIYNASMQIGLDVTYTATPCCGIPSILPPLTVHYNTSRFFNVNYVYQ